MTREQAKELLPIIQAYAEGKEIQYKRKDEESWDNFYFIGNEFHTDDWEYRIKPEPKLRPYKDVKEFLNDLKKHGPYFGDGERYYCMELVSHLGVSYNTYNCSFDCLLEKYKWQDGTPCGVMED